MSEQNNSAERQRREEEAVRAAYAAAKANFSEEDLQSYYEEEVGVPFLQVIEELEEINRQYKQQKVS